MLEKRLPLPFLLVKVGTVLDIELRSPDDGLCLLVGVTQRGRIPKSKLLSRQRRFDLRTARDFLSIVLPDYTPIDLSLLREGLKNLFDLVRPYVL